VSGAAQTFERSRNVKVVHYQGIVDDAVLGELWSLYRTAYAVRPPEVTREVLNRVEFYETLGLPSTQIWVVRHEGRPLGLLVAETRLDRSQWINTDYLARQFPDQTSARRVAYVTALAVDPDADGFVARRCMTAGVAHFAAEEMVLVFDVTDHLQDDDLAGGTAGAAQALVKRHDADVALLGITRYYAADFSRRPA
jgi:hypothetical protein